jgi:hypothetical protein
MKVTAKLFYGSEIPGHEFAFEIDYVAELYEAMNDEVEKLPPQPGGTEVGNWTRASIELVRES